MCGLVGIASKNLSDAEKKAFFDLLYLDVLRGEDSTGVAVISNIDRDTEAVTLFKSVGPPTKFFEEHGKPVRNKDFTPFGTNILIGHNRFATQGGVTEDNAHPFEFENLVGAHNGTVSQQSLRDFHGFKELDIDSQIIYSHLSHTQSIEEVWKEADGAMALTWWDKVKGELNFIRNSQRPLNYAYTEDNKTILWASEMWMLYVVASRQGLKMQTPLPVKEDCLYTFTLTDKEVESVERPIAPFVKKPTQQSWYYQGQYGTGTYDDWSSDWREPKDKQKKQANTKIISIREIAPVAGGSIVGFAYTSDGATVEVIIPKNEAQAIKQKIVGRGHAKGYYFCRKLNESYLDGKTYWCLWKDLTYIQLKGESYILRTEAGGFEIIQDNSKKGAPWYKPDTYLLQSAYLARTKCGCTNCLRVPTWEDKNDLLWFDHETFVCKDCSELSYVKDLRQTLQQEMEV